MNAPERYEAYLLGDEEVGLEYAKDEKIQNAGTFTIHKQDHTLGNLVRMQLLRDDKVRFAGYQMPHPLEHRCLVKVQTKSSNPGPIDAMKVAVDDLEKEFEDIDRSFREQVEQAFANRQQQRG